MAYLLEKDPEGKEDRVIFLYKLVDGVCPDSFGINVAKLAHIPDSVLHRAREMADHFNIDLSRNTPEVRIAKLKQLIPRLQQIVFTDAEQYSKSVRALLNCVVCLCLFPREVFRLELVEQVFISIGRSYESWIER